MSRRYVAYTLTPLYIYIYIYKKPDGLYKGIKISLHDEEVFLFLHFLLYIYLLGFFSKIFLYFLLNNTYLNIREPSSL
jgi:hypothetical protein